MLFFIVAAALASAGPARAATSLGREASTNETAHVSGSASQCLKIRRRIPAGEVLSGSDVEAVECPEAKERAPFRYDRRQRSVRALRDIAQGEVIPGVPAFAIAEVKPGQRLYVTARIGPVRVERAVEAVQAGTTGRRLFVKGEDGVIFSAGEPQPVR